MCTCLGTRLCVYIRLLIPLDFRFRGRVRVEEVDVDSLLVDDLDRPLVVLNGGVASDSCVRLVAQDGC